MKKLPIGIQNIREILEENQVYIDKTLFAKELIETGKYYFISRPRRFGKSLFLNTLKEILAGNRELFKRCKIYKSDYNWQTYPVVYLDFSKIANSTPDELKTALKIRLEIIAKEHEISIITTDLQVALDTLIVGLSNKYNSKIAVLIDEYDKPIIDHLKNLDTAKQNRDTLKGFFGTLKGLDAQLRFIFVTGISKFSQVSLFSSLNNLNDITMDPKYAELMGYTEGEIKSSFAEHIEPIIAERPETSKEEILKEIQVWYNGYRFSEKELFVYNPFSTLKYMQGKQPKAYWYSTGTPSFLVHQLKTYPKSILSLDGTTAREDELMDISSLEHIDLKALMYQAGYFTIQDYNTVSKRYYLGLPNEEVRTAFMNSLVRHFTDNIDVRSSEKFVKALEKYEVDILFEHIKVGLASFAYQVFAGAKERTYQAMLLSMLYGMGFDPLSERSINTGRIDVVLEMAKASYILELKLDNTADAALKQIHQKEYFKPYLHKGKEVVIVGANFSSEERNVSEWKGELLSESGEVIRRLSSEEVIALS
ncbi:ATP-binding protein [Candidatus Neptunochlamydia vexilliferae]|nr:ATP-binding protein [Candidatus Neptunochlamydia vexilliferae]